MLFMTLCVYLDDGDWETHHDQLSYVSYDVAYPDDDFDELELQEVFHSHLFVPL